jgi:ZIP family zinc transporter
MTVDSPNVAVAFALVCGAGAATALGAAVVFVPSLVKLASKRVLAAGLGLSAGVMTYVSFVEIFQKSYKAFLSAGYEEGHAYTLATGTFFCGVIFMVVCQCRVFIAGDRRLLHPLTQNIQLFGAYIKKT